MRSKNDVGDEPGEMGDALPAVQLGAGRSALAVSVVGLGLRAGLATIPLLIAVVIDTIARYERHDHANVHRGVHTLSQVFDTAAVQLVPTAMEKQIR